MVLAQCIPKPTPMSNQGLLTGCGAVVSGGSRGIDAMTMRASLDSAAPAFVAPLYAYLASDLARDVTGQIFVAAGGFVGSFDRPTPRVLGYRDHHDAEPWSVADLHKMISAAANQ